MKNIRSYTEATINFNKGKTLFEGDIGSGKSTILLAVEFALFGLGDTKAAALLKLGTREGCVSLTINEVDGHKFGVNIISHTQAVTSFGNRKAGDRVNMEIDTIARYVARLMGKD